MSGAGRASWHTPAVGVHHGQHLLMGAVIVLSGRQGPGGGFPAAGSGYGFARRGGMRGGCRRGDSDDGGRRSSPRPIFRPTSRLATFTLSDPDGAVDALVGRRADRDPVSRSAGGRRDPSVSGSRSASSGAGTVRRGPSRRHGRDRGSRVPGTQVDQSSGQDRLAQLLFHASAAVSQQRSSPPSCDHRLSSCGECRL